MKVNECIDAWYVTSLPMELSLKVLPLASRKYCMIASEPADKWTDDQTTFSQVDMPIPRRHSTSLAHFAPTTADSIGNISCQMPRCNRVANQITRSGMQSPIWLNNKTVDHQPATPTAFDPCRQRCPDNDHHCRDLRHPAPAVVTDELTPSK
jgi:hypothetical protein